MKKQKAILIKDFYNDKVVFNLGEKETKESNFVKGFIGLLIVQVFEDWQLQGLYSVVVSSDCCQNCHG